MKEVFEKIRSEIKTLGVVPFATFMRLALYCPVYGYYEKEEDTVGPSGDYYTSVSVGPLFGQLLAFRFAEWLDPGPNAPRKAETQPSASASSDAQAQAGGSAAQIVEAGAHRGDLAKDILAWLRDNRPALFDRLEYWIIEPSPRRQTWQQQTLAAFGGKVRWFTSLGEPDSVKGHLPRAVEGHSKFPPLPGGEGRGEGELSCLGPSSPRSINGIIFSNELLDAMPVHRLGWDAQQRQWFEWGVAFQDEAFAWQRMPLTNAALTGLPTPGPVHPFNLPLELQEILPDGFTTEISPAALKWWHEAAGALVEGKLLTIDYGLDALDFFQPERSLGTLRAYHRHQPASDVLVHPGEQDLTAHVNFSLLKALGESCGLETLVDVGQAKFLTEIFSNLAAAEPSRRPWTTAQTRQFQTLTHPNHLGRSFRVLVQHRRPPAV